MDCPYCKQHCSSARCPQCHRTIDTDAADELAQIGYLRNRVDRWERQGNLAFGTTKHVIGLTEPDILRLRASIGLGHPAPLMRAQPEPTPTVAPLAAPPSKAQPARSPLTWSQVGAYLLSERALNTLLGLGALLILASAFVISTLNPTHLAPMAHLAVMFATTLAFYGAGYVVRQKMHLLRAGATLLVIGAGLIPLDTWAVGQEQIPHWNAGTVWLIASLVCLPISLASHMVLRDRAFAVLTALTGGSTLLAAIHQEGLPLEWGLCTLVGLAIAYLLLMTIVRERRPLLSWALFWTSQTSAPLLMAGLLSAKYVPQAWHLFVGNATAAPSDYAIGGAWWLGLAFYALCAALLRRRRYEVVAAWVLPISYLLTLTKMPWDASWYNLCLAVLTLAYVAYASLASKARPRSLAQRLVDRPAYGVAVTLTIVAALWPSATLESQIATLLTICVTYAVAALMLRERACAYVAAFTLPIAFALVLAKLGVDLSARPLAWAGLAIALIGAAESAARRSGEGRRPLPNTAIGLGTWKSRFAPALFAAGYAVSLVTLALCAERWGFAPLLYGIAVPPLMVIVALAGIVALYGASAVARRSSVFLYPAAVLAVPAYESFVALVARSAGHGLTLAAHVWLLALFGSAYLATAYGVASRWERFGRPYYLMGYGLIAVPMFVLGANRITTVQVGALNLLVFAWSGWLVHRQRHPSYLWIVKRLFLNEESAGFAVARTLFIYLFAWTFPAWLLLAMSLWQPKPDTAVYGLAGTLLAPVYAVLGRRFTRLADRSQLPWYIAGYALSVIGPVLASADATLRIVTVAISIALYAVSAAMSRRRTWLVPVALLIPVLFLLGLLRLDVPLRYYGLGLLPAMAGSLVTAELLRRRLDGNARGVARLLRARAWSAPFYTMVLAQGGLTTAILAAVGYSPDTAPATVMAALWTALAYCALALGPALLWTTDVAQWGSLAFGAVSVEIGLRLAGVPGIQQPPFWAALALVAGLAAFWVRRDRRARLQAWTRPLYIASMTVSVIALAAALSVEFAQMGHVALQSLTATLAVAGLTLVAYGFDQRRRALGYAGIGLVLISYMLQLTLFDVSQAEAFALPTGVYLLVPAYLEGRHGNQAGLRTALEWCGLAVLLITSVVQALGYAGSGVDRVGYDIFLFFESIVIVGLGAILHWKRSLYAGSAALIVDVGILLADPLRAMNTWYLMAIVGLTIIGLVIFLEQRRRQIPLWIDAWRDRLETWT